jgi:DNA-directed RNA polymerase alpha subunit
MSNYPQFEALIYVLESASKIRLAMQETLARAATDHDLSDELCRLAGQLPEPERNYVASILFRSEVEGLWSGRFIEVLSAPIERLELRTRSYNGVKERLGAQLIYDLVQKSSDDILRTAFMGRKSLSDVNEKLEYFGKMRKIELRLGMEPGVHIPYREEFEKLLASYGNKQMKL